MEIGVRPTQLSLGTVFLTFKDVAPSLDVLVGQIPSPFCLENSNSSKWLWTNERSLDNVFKPCIGPGISFNYHKDSWAFKTAIRQATLGTKTKVDGAEVNYNDHFSDAWGGSVRATYVPVNTAKSLLHLGVSISHQDIAGKGANENLISFKAGEVSGRDAEKTVKVENLAAKSYNVLGLEFSPQFGSFQLEAEALFAHVTMRTSDENENFWGGHAGINYFITGQKRTYDAKNGSFGKPTRDNVGSYGIWQAGLRYSHLDLTKKSDAQKNTGDNITAALNWYPAATDKLKVSANYVHAMSHTVGQKKELDTIVVRLQTVF